MSRKHQEGLFKCYDKTTPRTIEGIEMTACPCHFKKQIEENEPEVIDTADEMLTYASHFTGDDAGPLYCDGGLSSQPAIFFELKDHIRRCVSKEREKDMEERRKTSELKNSTKERPRK